MTVEVHPVGMACNLSCSYCYQHPIRDAQGNVKPPYDLEAMKASLTEEGTNFTIFGGEPLLMPLEDLEDLWAFGLKTYGRNGIQTNGSLITEKHLDAFDRFKVGVGMSIDGPGELNRTRWAGSEEKTDEMTRRSMRALRSLCERRPDWPPSIITTLSRVNAGDQEKVDALVAWFRDLSEMGIRHVNIHLMEIDHDGVKDNLTLDADWTIETLVRLESLMDLDGFRIKFSLFEDMNALLAGDDRRVTCIWRGCDHLTTSAVRGVDADGRRINCGRTADFGVDWSKVAVEGFERYPMLHATPQEHGGCQGCRFWYACKGNCPGTGEEYDWRNRSSHCEVWFKLFEHLEAKAPTRVSLSPDLPKIEAAMLAEFRAGRRPSLHHILNQGGNGEIQGGNASGNFTDHGDHYDDGAEQVVGNVPVKGAS